MSEKTPNDFFNDNKHIAETVAKKFPAHTCPQHTAEDILQEAYAALWAICVSEDADRDGGWVHVVIYNKVADVLRKAAPLPKSTYNALRAIKDTADALVQRGTPATDANIAKQLNMAQAEVRRLLAMTHRHMDTGHVEDTAHLTADAIAILATLDARDSDIMQMYMAGHTHKEIGEKYGISKQRIDQKIFAITDRLRRQFIDAIPD